MDRPAVIQEQTSHFWNGKRNTKGKISLYCSIILFKNFLVENSIIFSKSHRPSPWELTADGEEGGDEVRTRRMMVIVVSPSIASASPPRLVLQLS